MNNRTFNPTVDLPKCDICGATMVQMHTHLPGSGQRPGLEYAVVFACGALWRATRRVDYRRTAKTLPDGNYTPYDSAPTTFIEDDVCEHAAAIARKIRDDAGITPA